FSCLGHPCMSALLPYTTLFRSWMRHMCPMLGVATMTAGIWELATSCLGLLPLPYFPGPEGVFGSMVSDYRLLFDSTWHSLILLRSEEHTSELQSRENLVCRLLL